MKPLAYTSPYAWVFWAVFVFAYLPEFSVVARARPSPGENTDRGSTSLIVLAGWIRMTAAFAVAGIPAFSIAPGQKIWFIIGIVTLLCGSLLRRHCWRVLGQYFTGTDQLAQRFDYYCRGSFRLHLPSACRRAGAARQPGRAVRTVHATHKAVCALRVLALGLKLVSVDPVSDDAFFGALSQ